MYLWCVNLLVCVHEGLHMSRLKCSLWADNVAMYIDFEDNTCIHLQCTLEHRLVSAWLLE